MVNVIGDRCGDVGYDWQGYAAPLATDGPSLDWQGDYTATIYGGVPSSASPYDYGSGVIDSAHGTFPYVDGIDDFPSLRGSSTCVAGQTRRKRCRYLLTGTIPAPGEADRLSSSSTTSSTITQPPLRYGRGRA